MDPILIPITMFVCGTIIAVVGMVTRAKRKKLEMLYGQRMSETQSVVSQDELREMIRDEIRGAIGSEKPKQKFLSEYDDEDDLGQVQPAAEERRRSRFRR